MAEKEPKKEGAERQQPRALSPELSIQPQPGLMRYSVNLAGQQLGNVKRAKQLKLLPEDTPEDELVIDLSGLELTYTEARVLHTIIKLLHNTGYGKDGAYLGHSRQAVRSTMPDVYKDIGGIIELPEIAVTPIEIIEAYGLQKGASGRYPRAQRDAILNALESLATKIRSIYYERPVGRERKTVKVESPLIQVTKFTGYDGTIEEAKAKQITPRITKLLITPHYLLVDRLKTFHFLRDIELYSRIDKVLSELRGSRKGRKGNYHADFITWLQSLDYPKHTIKKDTLATRIRLGYLAKQRRRADIEKALQEAIEVAMKLGYLLTYRETASQDGKPMYEFELNPEMCSRIQARLERENKK